MSDSAAFDDSLSPAEQGTQRFPNGGALPPVEPPSAGFIVQLFVVPALIVAAVIGVYLLFGRLAANEVDWRELVIDLRSGNPHTRWRGAYGLAQLLEADAARRAVSGEAAEEATAGAGSAADRRPLARDPELATELSVTLADELGQPGNDEDHRRLLEYLIKSVGWMDVPETVVPVLRSACRPERDPWIRQQAFLSLGMALGRSHLAGHPVDDRALTQELIEATARESGLLRHVATYSLGFVAGEDAQARLRVLINDPDPKTRANAASGLARNGSLAAVDSFAAVLEEAGRQNFDPHRVSGDDEANAYFERAQLVSNALAFVEQAAPRLAAEEHARFERLTAPLTTVPDAKLRHQAIQAQHALRLSAAAAP